MGLFLPDCRQTLALKNKMKFITDCTSGTSKTLPLTPGHRIVTTRDNGKIMTTGPKSDEKPHEEDVRG